MSYDPTKVDQPTYDLVLSAYNDEIRRWQECTKELERDIRSLIDKIFALEGEINTSKVFSRVKSKLSGINQWVELENLNDKLVVLKRQQEMLDKNKPDLTVYELGAINNTLFYVRSVV